MDKKIYAYGVCLYKVSDTDIKILLCKSISSLNKWGFLKGVQCKNESSKECAKREFMEECSIPVDEDDFEEYFEQENEEKNVGIWLLNANKVRNLNKYIIDDKLLSNYLSWENSKVRFFSIDELPSVKSKQKFMMKEITDFLRNTHQHH